MDKIENLELVIEGEPDSKKCPRCGGPYPEDDEAIGWVYEGYCSDKCAGEVVDAIQNYDRVKAELKEGKKQLFNTEHDKMELRNGREYWKLRAEYFRGKLQDVSVSLRLGNTVAAYQTCEETLRGKRS